MVVIFGSGFAQDFLTGLQFAYDEVYLSEVEERKSVIEWSPLAQFYSAVFVLKSIHIFITIAYYLHKLWSKYEINVDLSKFVPT